MGLFAMVAPSATRLQDYPPVEEWDLREALNREKQSLGFYVSGHPLDRYGAERLRDITPAGAVAAQEPWSKVQVAGMVEGYRERIFKGGGGKIAFFTLEDTSGRVEVKVRQQQIETHSHVLTSGEPIVVSGKVSYPMTDEAEDADAPPREPTLMLDEARLLVDVIRQETKSIAIRLHERKARPEQLGKLGEVLRGSPGGCPVQLVIQLESGSEAILSLKGVRVEPSDGMLGRLEKLFGEKVAELR